MQTKPLALLSRSPLAGVFVALAVIFTLSALSLALFPHALQPLGHRARPGLRRPHHHRAIHADGAWRTRPVARRNRRPVRRYLRHPGGAPRSRALFGDASRHPARRMSRPSQRPAGDGAAPSLAGSDDRHGRHLRRREPRAHPRRGDHRHSEGCAVSRPRRFPRHARSLRHHCSSRSPSPPS